MSSAVYTGDPDVRYTNPGTTITEQVIREAPDIEAYKLGLLEAGKTLANIPIRLPEQRVLGQDPLETAAYDYLGGIGTSGIGGYAPLATTARGTLGTGLGTLGSAQDLLGTGVSRMDEATAAMTTAYGARVDEAPAALAPAYGALVGVAGEFDPTTVSQYMDPYEEAVVQSALADIQREGDIAQRTLDAGAVGAGAFGGSRQGIERAEIVRNMLEQQAKMAAQLRSAGYQSALGQAQNAFEQARQRQLAQSSAYAGLAGQQGAIGQGIASIGGQVGGLGVQQAGLGMQQLGAAEQAQRQRLLDLSSIQQAGQGRRGVEQARVDAAAETRRRQLYEPYTRVSYLSDIYKGAPTSSATLQGITAPRPPSPSLFQQLAPLATAATGLAGAATAAKKAGVWPF